MKIIDLQARHEQRIDIILVRAKKIFDEVYNILQRKYHCDRRTGTKNCLKLALILDSSEKSLDETCFLDLGCGANGSTQGISRPENSLGRYEPWIPRIIHELGGKVFGVDIGSLDGEKFPYIENRNLLLPNSLFEIPSGTIDLAYAFRLFKSPTLRTYTNSPEELKTNLLTQLERVLKPDCAFAYYPRLGYNGRPVFNEHELRRAA